MLISFGVHLNIKDSKGNTPLHIAIDNRWGIKIVSILIRAKAELNEQNNYGDTPLHIATTAQSDEIVRALIKAGVNPNIQNGDGQTPLHIALDIAFISMEILDGREPNLYTIKLLIRHHSNLTMVDNNGKSPSDLIIVYNLMPNLKQILTRYK